MTTTPAILARGLTKAFGDVRALNGLDLTVPEATVVALLGPNGAGKTTAIRILTTLLSPDAGTATVADADVVAEPAEVRRRIGLSGQYAAVDEYLTGSENLELIGRLYHLGAKRSRARAAELLQRFGLTHAASRPVGTPTRAACAAAWTWPAPWSPPRPCCFSTSRPPAWTPTAATSSGTSSGTWSPRAAPCC